MKHHHTTDHPVFCPACSRRSLLTGAAALALTTTAARAQVSPPDNYGAPDHSKTDHLVDVHFHVGSPMLAALQGKRGGRPGSNPSAETLLGVLDEGGVQIGVCSSIIPTDVTNVQSEITAASRDANEWMAKLRHDHPTRFGILASLPLPDIDATLKEIAYAFDTLKADGVHMPTYVGGHWFGEPWFAPVLDELNRRKAIIKTHPALPDSVKMKDFAFVGTGIVELGTDTMRSMQAFLFSGMANKYKDVKVIWSLAGGAFLGQAQRFVNAADSGKFKAQLPDGPMAELKRHYYDIAQALHPATQRELKNFVPNSQILFGTDYPFWTPKRTIDAIRVADVFSESDIAGWGSNAKKLFALKA